MPRKTKPKSRAAVRPPSRPASLKSDKQTTPSTPLNSRKSPGIAAQSKPLKTKTVDGEEKSRLERIEATFAPLRDKSGKRRRPAKPDAPPAPIPSIKTPPSTESEKCDAPAAEESSSKDRLTNEIRAHSRTVIPLPTKHRDSQQRDKRTEAARKRIGLGPESMRGVPRVAHILAQAAGGLDTIFSALRISDDSDAKAFLAKYDSISESDLARLTLEEVAVAAGVGTRRLLEIAVSSLVEDSRSAGAIIAASYQPAVIEATARMAIHPLGSDDRKMFHTATGWLPTAKAPAPGSPVNVFFNNSQQLAVVPGQNSAELSSGVPFVSTEDELKSLHTEIDGSRLLPEPKPVEDVDIDTPAHVIAPLSREVIGVILPHDEEELDCIPNPR